MILAVSCLVYVGHQSHFKHRLYMTVYTPSTNQTAALEGARKAEECFQKLVKTSRIQSRYSKFTNDRGRYMIFFDCWDIVIIIIVKVEPKSTCVSDT